MALQSNISPRKETENDRSAEFDVFLSYHTTDLKEVLAIQSHLKSRGARTFVDRQTLAAGIPWPTALQGALRIVRTVLVFVGKSEAQELLGPWQKRELWFALDRQVREEQEGRAFPVIPVLLPGARPDSSFLFVNSWVDLRNGL